MVRFLRENDARLFLINARASFIMINSYMRIFVY